MKKNKKKMKKDLILLCKLYKKFLLNENYFYLEIIVKIYENF